MEEISEVVAGAIEEWFFGHDRDRVWKRLDPNGPYDVVEGLTRGFDMAARNIMLRLAEEARTRKIVDDGDRCRTTGQETSCTCCGGAGQQSRVTRGRPSG